MDNRHIRSAHSIRAAVLIAGGTLIGPKGDAGPGWLSVDDGKITGIGSGNPPRQPEHDFRPYTITPGFIDIHLHGGGGRSFEEKNLDAAQAVLAAHRAHGTTTAVASLISAPLDELVAAMHTYRPLVESGLLAGIHLEGPFLSAEYRGAHPARHLRAPDPTTLARLLEAGRGILAVITLAPELDGAIPAIQTIRAAGVQAAVGHTAATYEQTVAAIQAGATIATHLCNAMQPPHHRTPGPVTALLENPRIAVELIADGIHLHPAVLALLARTAGPDRTVMISDAIAAAASADGTYTLAGQPVHAKDGRALIAGTDILAGSTLTLDAALRHAVASGIPLPAAITSLTTNPARLLGLKDRGQLTTGQRADLVILNEHLHVHAIITNGQLQVQQQQ